MRTSFVLKLLLVLSILFWALVQPVSGSGNGESQELQKKLEALSKRAEQTTSLTELMEILQEIKKLSQELMKSTPGFGGGTLPLGPARTPEEEVDRRIESINSSYRDLMRTVQGISAEGPLIPVDRAGRLHGYVLVRGKDSEPAYRGWVWIRLNYSVKEDFVGYLIIREYYDPKTRRFVDKKDYLIHSISTRIDVSSASGRQCVEASAELPGNCADWEYFSTYEIDKGDVYPQLHSDVITASSTEGRAIIKVESPTVLFQSPSKRVARGLGCYGTEFEIAKSEFEQSLGEGVLKRKRDVGHKFEGSPGCDFGSTIELSIAFCDPKHFAEQDICQQIKSLIGHLSLSVRLRDLFREEADEARDVKALVDSVEHRISIEFPGQGQQQESLEAGFRLICAEKTGPTDLCRECYPRPLCEWLNQATQVHEKTHELDVGSNPRIKNLFCRTQFHSKAEEREMVKLYADMEYNAYDADARYLRDVIEELLDKHMECVFGPETFIQLQKAIQDLEKGHVN